MNNKVNKYEMNYNKDTYNKRFEKALAIKYRKFDPWKRRREFIKAYELKYADDKTNIVTQIKNWSTIANQTLPSVTQLIKICDVLECDIDFFLTDDPEVEFNSDMSVTSKTTGLSNEAIMELKKMDEEALLILDVLLENNSMEAILHSISSMNKTAGILELEDISTGKKEKINVSNSMKNYAYVESIINECTSVRKSKKYDDYMTKKFIENRGQIPIDFENLKQKYAEVPKEIKKILKKTTKTFNELCDEETP